jgi:hypothetical protein
MSDTDTQEAMLHHKGHLVVSHSVTNKDHHGSYYETLGTSGPNPPLLVVYQIPKTLVEATGAQQSTAVRLIELL